MFYPFCASQHSAADAHRDRAAVTVVVAPTLVPAAYVSPFSDAGVLLIIQQVVIGLAVGFVMQIFFAAAELAGAAIGLQMGLSFATLIDARSTDPLPIIGTYLPVTLMLVFLALNGHLMLSTTSSIRSRAFRSMAKARCRRSTCALAMPVIVAMLLADLALGVLTRTAPQLNLFEVGFPVTLGTGLAMLGPFVVPAMEGALLRGLALVAR